MQTIPFNVPGVIPPHILRTIAEQADPEARASAQRTLDQLGDLTLRTDPTLIDSPGGPGATVRKRRHVYDAQRRFVTPGRLAMTEGKRRVSDRTVMEAWDAAGTFHDFLSKVFKRDSIDGRGRRIDSTVHYGVEFNNALWNGRQIVFGDGDGRYFHRFTGSLDVVGHELGHAVTTYDAGLGYRGQNGALNEHISDVFGTLCKQWVRGETAREGSWLIGEGLFGPAVQNGAAIRSMKAPGTAYDDPLLGRDPQPWHMRDYVETAEDNGGVHINSGIPNHAFYRLATTLGGDSWAVAGQIWYRAMRKARPDADFSEFAHLTAATAAEFITRDLGVQRTVIEAWQAVGVPITSDALARLSVRIRTQRTNRAAPPAAAAKWRTRPALSQTRTMEGKEKS